MKIKDSIKVLFSVGIVFAGIAAGVYYIFENSNSSWFSGCFVIGLTMLKESEGILFHACVLSAIMIFLTAILDAILKNRVGLTPIVSAVYFLLAMAPFMLFSFVHIQREWFILILLFVHIFITYLSLRKMLKHSIGKNTLLVSMPKYLKLVSMNNNLDTVDKTITMTAACLLFILLFIELILLGRHISHSRNLMFGM